MLLDIVVLPPKELCSRIAHTAKVLNKKFHCEYLIDNKHVLPHISLYHLEIKSKDLSKVERFVKSLSKIQKRFIIRLGKAEARRTVFAYPLKKSRQWENLHETVVASLMSLRVGVMSAAFDFPPGSEEVVKKLGSPFVMELNWPHITLGKVFSMDDITSVLKVVPRAFPTSFEVNEIAIAQVNTQWQVTKILKRIQLH